MGSIFTGLAEFINNIKALEASNASDYKTLYLAQVLGVITGEELDQAILDGTLDDFLSVDNLYSTVGVIRYKRQTTDDNKYEDTVARIAYPADRSNMRMPVPGELVLVMSTQSDTSTPQRKIELYTSVITGQGITR